MPFKETCRMEERIRMLAEYATGNFSVAELCRRYGVCRDTFYAWRKRRDSGATDWFEDRSHAPQHCPHRTDGALIDAIIALRRKFPYLGPRKLRAVLERRHPEPDWPAASTIGDILKQVGLVAPVKRRRPAIEQPAGPPEAAQAANDEWSVDFKGWFRTRDRSRIDPLTMADSYSRFLIAVQNVPATIEGAQPVFAAVFREYGLPLSIRCDNGTPFGSRAAGGLTRLSAWWLKLGIKPGFIQPASPQENGRHERMHRTLKQQTLQPLAADAAEQQARFDDFRRHYNHERPHEALGQRPPAELYARSTRAMPDRVEEPCYDAEHEVRRVRSSGEIRWQGERIFVSEALIGEPVGIAELQTGEHVVRFCAIDIGLIDHTHRFRRFAPLRRRLREPAKPATEQKLSGIIPVQNVDHHPG
jgi:transposase InsO family protein